MGFVGNKQGPRKSEIIATLGPEYFGISMDELEVDIRLLQEEEAEGVVDPVYEDGNGRHYIELMAPGRRVQKFVLEEHGYRLEGPIDRVSERN